MKRREFLKTSIAASAAILSTTTLSAGETRQPIDNRKVSDMAFPQKRPLITYSDRPPLLESPRSTFARGITQNDEFFVRWHLPDIPTHIDTDSYTIKIDGLVEQDLEISLKELKNDFEQVEVTAVLQCGGNSRSAFTPIPGGIQWGSGAMGCAKWKGVRLSDLLNRAGLKKDAHWIGFNGLEKAAYYKTPNFVRELELTELDDHVIVAYQMNGEDLPYLNGFPLRLVLPGYYSDSWVKMLSNITVTDKYKSLFFMDMAYRVPDNKCECETPEHHFKPTKPITNMNVKSVIGYPENGMKVYHNSHVVVRGVAFDDGHGIREVLVSVDGGKTWDKAELKQENGRYAYTEFRYAYKPADYGKVTFMTKAVNRLGDEQPFAKDIGWNHGGYKYNGIDEVTVEVV
ncbi:molybdopterin-dependent oxidoreductase [Sulfurimonas autotrophica]|uniref:Sulfite dehydrogenase (Cytochrome) subunit SorA apoprotein n=1 Tax=Sulfurimonas autotrophica (strain ATCC BAA-671 / DSM 16294 / JCM 11897 / OK10) TaxID=563040 RepID=E0US48_SULAO|nr:molybdopterin-dependent oxidoreductase [Sulfurimonas autotrophica]ADN09071.1 sulfite dehydrogenase (cytochrome) subunit SorA apoprotein [Sulfurimonas autotrophica DSM 16294]